MKIITHDCDVLVAGGGAAGLKAAASLLEGSGSLNVALVVKGSYGRCGTTANAVSDRMAFHATMPYTEPGGSDNWKYHASDIFKIGRYVSDLPLAEILAKESSLAASYLESASVPFALDASGKLSQFLTDGSVYPRACYTGPYTAIDMEKGLLKKLENLGPHIYEGYMLADIAVDEEGKVSGAFCIDRNNGVVFFRTRFVIIASGGGGSIFENNCFPSGMTGDGYAAALRCGTSLVNMEFIQFGICSSKLKVACSGSLMRSVPRILDEKGEEVLAESYKDPADIFSVVFRKGASWPVSYEEESQIIDIAARRNKKLFLDYTKNPAGWSPAEIPINVKKWYSDKGFELGSDNPCDRLRFINPEIFAHFSERGIDLSVEKMEVFSAAQHFQGGIKIDENGESNVKGLFACGEAAGGQHGANRPGGNALLDTQVFGRRAAMEVLRRLSEKEGICCKASAEDMVRESYSGETPEKTLLDVSDEVKKICSRYLCLERTEEGAGDALSILAELKKLVKPSSNLKLYFETLNSLMTAQVVALGCFERRESRGPHLFWKDGELLPSDSRFDYRYVKVGLSGGELASGWLDVKK